MKNNIIKCSDCNCCESYRKSGNTTTNFNCNHPNKAYIHNYFKEHDIKKMVGFLGFSKPHSDKVPLKASPTWCPKKAKLK